MRRRAALPAFIAIGVIAFTAGAIVASSVGLKVWTDPDAGLSEAERRAAHDQNSAEFWARYELWLDEQKKLDVDPRSYPVTELLASVAEPAPNLTEAVGQAELIVSGTVESVDFRYTADALIRISVADTIKGNPGETVDVILPNALMPDERWENPQIGSVEAMPMVYPGDTVVMFLVADPNTKGAYDVLPWTGTYTAAADGRLNAVNGNPFAKHIEVLTLESFLDATRAAAS